MIPNSANQPYLQKLEYLLTRLGSKGRTRCKRNLIGLDHPQLQPHFRNFRESHSVRPLCRWCIMNNSRPQATCARYTLWLAHEQNWVLNRGLWTYTSWNVRPCSSVVIFLLMSIQCSLAEIALVLDPCLLRGCRAIINVSVRF